MTRTALPPRRMALTFDMAFDPLTHNSPRYTVTAGLMAEGGQMRVREVFASCHTITSAQDIAARDTAILLSIALQSGQSLEELSRAMTRDGEGRPQGLAARLADELLALETATGLSPGEGA